MESVTKPETYFKFILNFVENLPKTTIKPILYMSFQWDNKYQYMN